MSCLLSHTLCLHVYILLLSLLSLLVFIQIQFKVREVPEDIMYRVSQRKLNLKLVSLITPLFEIQPFLFILSNSSESFLAESTPIPDAGGYEPNAEINVLCHNIGIHRVFLQTWKKSQACKQCLRTILRKLWTFLVKQQYSCHFHPSMPTCLHFYQQLMHFCS